MTHGRIINSDFRPPWWLKNPHLQTLWPKLLMHLGQRASAGERPQTPLQRRRIELADGDFIDLSVGVGGTGPRVLILHGLEGGLDSHYAGSLVDRLARNGLQPIFMHLRGASGEPNRLARSYHSGATEDLRAVLEVLAEDPEGPATAAIGFSLGGNLLLKYLGECWGARGAEPRSDRGGQRRDEWGDPLLERAVAISVPFVLRDAMLRLELGFARVYRGYLISRLKAAYQHKFAHRPAPLSVDLSQIKDFNQFDDQITAPLNGFAGVFDYYQRASCRGYLRPIRTPTLIIHAADDPFMFPSTVPFEHELGPGIRLELARHGGHVGFIAAQGPGYSSDWLETKLLRALLE
ncbi:YheT family hydrolase [Halochromatium salexigens]|uniref:Alpha/beta hydrolase n=1 Tax=Halochromatium salexigens TaxID=49447 RepID=A0AAJ0UIZ3_HALSE|nr:alpha/beta fold hydrolase [Halochromatium salexigens]MBK5931402.1 alpha/beta hydrolase [Halochromatium salexigens]